MESRSGLIVDAQPHLGAWDAGARAGYRRRLVVAVLLGADTGSNAADFATVNVPRSWPSASPTWRLIEISNRSADHFGIGHPAY